MRNFTKSKLAAFGFAMAAATASAQQTPPAGQPGTVPPPAPRQAQPGQVQSRPAQGVMEALDRRPGDMPGPIDSLQDVQDTLKLAFMMADQDHNGLISQKEATDLANLTVGGFFFAADTNGDGTISKDESQAAREKVLKQNPLLRFALQRAKDPNEANLAGTQAFRGLAELIDANDDKAVQANEVRQSIVSAVQGIYGVADTDRDGNMSPNELNAAVYSLAEAAMQASFQNADADKSGGLSKEEFVQSLTEPANTVFDVLDANLDGELTPDEVNRAGQVIAGQLRLFQPPQATNSPGQMIENRTGAGAPGLGNQRTPNTPR